MFDGRKEGDHIICFQKLAILRILKNVQPYPNSICVHLYKCMYVGPPQRPLMNTGVRMYECMYVRIYMNVCTVQYVYMHACMYIYICMHE
jgi:hypothetical protein